VSPETVKYNRESRGTGHQEGEDQKQFIRRTDYKEYGFLGVTQCSLVKYQRFVGIYRLHLQGQGVSKERNLKKVLDLLREFYHRHHNHHQNHN
jgi:hypothetical protein